MRPDRVLHELPVSQWTRDEAYVHLSETFDAAARQRPDLLEPYMIRLDGTDDEQQRAVIMRQGLKETFGRRHPSRLKRSD